MSSRNITAEREKQRQAVSGGAGCSNPVVFCGQYQESLRGGRVLDWAVRGHFSSPRPSIGRSDEETGGEGAEPGDAERPVCLGMLPISEDKSQKGHLTSFEPVKECIGLPKRTGSNVIQVVKYVYVCLSLLIILV